MLVCSVQIISRLDSSLRSKRFRGAKSEEETGLSAFFPRKKWGESTNKICSTETLATQAT